MRRELSLSLRLQVDKNRPGHMGLPERVWPKASGPSVHAPEFPPVGDLQARINMLPEKMCVLIADNGLEECCLLLSYI